MPSAKEIFDSAVARISADPSYSAYVAMSNALHDVVPEATELQPLKIAISRNFTIDAMLPVLEGELVRAGFYPKLFLGEYDAISQDLLDPESALYAFAPDLIIVAQWLETLAPRFSTRFLSLALPEVDAEMDRILEEARSRLAALRQRSAAPVLINNFVLPAYPTMGILDAQSDSHQSGSILRLNAGLRQCARDFPDVYLVDVMGLTARIGYAQAFDEKYWHIGRAPLGRTALTMLAREYVKFVRALRGNTRKCLVLDCDNTLWGGVIGEDGVEGIKLGSTYPGSCYAAFQREILNLKDRGIILALCSKNDEEDVRDVLRGHPDMLLRERDFATWQIDWNDKVTNLRKIAGGLNLGLDALVFADDSRFECDFVRENLPQVEVIHLGNEPSAYPRLLAAGAFFDSLILSDEDRARTEMYKANVQRHELQETTTSLSDYLAGLQMVATLGAADDMTIPRIAQLTQKTNQFNLTTRRYSESEIRALSSDPSLHVIYMKLRDRVSDLGLVGVAILRYEADVAQIDTFLLSCRALGREAEKCLLSNCLKSARSRRVARVLGRYSCTPKNTQVADFYSRCGFTQLSQNPKESLWEFQVNRDSFSSSELIRIEQVASKETLCPPMKAS
jgi:FkbH-like protein